MQIQHKRGNTSTATFWVEAFDSEAMAEIKCQDYLTEDVFSNMSAWFPQPQRYDVRAAVVSAKPKELENPEHPFEDWAVEIEVEVKGAKADRERWLKRMSDLVEGNV